jgi:hypothetical protein
LSDGSARSAWEIFANVVSSYATGLGHWHAGENVLPQPVTPRTIATIIPALDIMRFPSRGPHHDQALVRDQHGTTSQSICLTIESAVGSHNKHGEDRRSQCIQIN